MNRYIFSRKPQISSILLNVPKRISQEVCLSNKSSSSNSSSSSSSDDEKKSSAKKRSNAALEKLNELLKTMINEDVSSSKTTLNLAKPTDKRKKGREDKVLASSKQETRGVKLKSAVKDVAETLGGDVKKIESELLMKLLNTADDKTTSLSELVKGMKIDSEQPPKDQSKAQQIRQILQSKTNGKYYEKRQRTFKPQKTELVTEKVDIFGSEPLGIFTPEYAANATEGVENKTWKKLYKKDLKLAVTHPPSNYFQQMILWTDQGKVWKFPIDNEQDLVEEKKVDFTEHIFLDKYLESWCPPKGPLRHFMELVCVGLSKNPYLTVEAKKEHIMWFKNYFEEKRQLLKDTGVIQNIESFHTKNETKQIE